MRSTDGVRRHGGALMLFAIRHAPTDVAGRCVGQTDVPTTIEADEAAERALAALAGRTVGSIWTSPLARCRGLAERLAAAMSADLHVDERLLEADFGEWEGRRWADIEATDGMRLAEWMASWVQTAPPGGESAALLQARVHRWWSALDPQGHRLLVAHAGVVRALWVCSGSPWPEAMARPVPHLELLELSLPR